MISIPDDRLFLRQKHSSSSSRATKTVFIASVITILLLGGCASDQVSDCQKIAGDGWKVLSHPPTNAVRLLSLEGVESDHSVVWLGRGKKRVLACHYEASMTSPGCSESRGYEFWRTNSGWKSKGILLSPCDATQ